MNKALKGFGVALLGFAVFAGMRKMGFAQTPLGPGQSDAVSGQDREQVKTVTGRVVGAADAPINGAVVFLKNTKTLAVKSFIADTSGGFRFNGLSPNIDYEIYAESNGKRSGTKTVSSFDSKTQVNLTLRIE